MVDDIPHVGVLDTYRPLKGINGSQVLVRQVRCPQLVEGTFPLSYYSFDTLIKLLLLLLLLLLGAFDVSCEQLT